MTRALPAGSSHLLVADDALSDGHRTGTYVAACGALLSALAPSCRPPERDRLYCQKCVLAAARWSCSECMSRVAEVAEAVRADQAGADR